MSSGSGNSVFHVLLGSNSARSERLVSNDVEVSERRGSQHTFLHAELRGGDFLLLGAACSFGVCSLLLLLLLQAASDMGYRLRIISLSQGCRLENIHTMDHIFIILRACLGGNGLGDGFGLPSFDAVNIL